MTHKEIEMLILRVHNEVWNQGKLDVVEELFSQDFRGHYPSDEMIGVEGVKNTVQFIRNAFPDWHEEVKDIIISNDKAVSRYVGKGTHNGYLRNLAPTGNDVEMNEMAIFRIENGKIAELWGIFDHYKMMKQIGAIKE